MEDTGEAVDHLKRDGKLWGSRNDEELGLRKGVRDERCCAVGFGGVGETGGENHGRSAGAGQATGAAADGDIDSAAAGLVFGGEGL